MFIRYFEHDAAFECKRLILFLSAKIKSFWFELLFCNERVGPVKIDGKMEVFDVWGLV